MMPSDGPLRCDWRERFEDRVDHSLWNGHPPPHRGWSFRADDAPWRKNNLERPKRTVVDREQCRRRETFEGDFRCRAARRRTRVEIAGDLLTNSAQVDSHRVVAYDHL